MTDTLRSELVPDAFREGNLIAIGSSPTTAEQTEGRTLMDRLIASLIGNEIGEAFYGLPFPLPDKFLSGDPALQNHGIFEDPRKPRQNRRIVCSNPDTLSIEWEPRPNDGARMAVVKVSGAGDIEIDAQGHFIDPGDRTLQTTLTLSLSVGEYYEWLYRADLSMWVITATNVSSATTLDSSPFPPELDGLLVAGTSIRLQARYGNEPLQGTVAEYTRMIRIARARYNQTMAKETNPSVPLGPSTIDSYGDFLG